VGNGRGTLHRRYGAIKSTVARELMEKGGGEALDTVGLSSSSSSGKEGGGGYKEI